MSLRSPVNLWHAVAAAGAAWGYKQRHIPIQHIAPSARDDSGVADRIPLRDPDRSAKRLGLHVTDLELDIWRKRAKEGPYKSKGDATTNSPGDWDRIQLHADLFLADPDAVRWRGPSHGSGAVVNSRAWPRDLSGAPPRKAGPERLRDAAFYAMVAERDVARIVQHVKRQLLWHTEQPLLDFSDNMRWSPETFGKGYHPAFQISAWLRKLAYGFDYARIAAPSQWSPSEEKQFLAWLEAAARWYMPQVDARRRGMWDSEGRPSRAADRWGGPDARPIWANGPVTKRVQHRYNNHVNRFAVLITDVGILAGNEELKNYGRRWVEEFLKVCVYPEGGISDFYRWDDRRMGHLQGWKYGVCMVGATTIIADHLARIGDATAYRFSTTIGTRDTVGNVLSDQITTGGPKTLLTSARQVIRYVDELSTPFRHACMHCDDSEHRIGSRDGTRGINRVDDWLLMQGNVFHRDPYIRSVYMRSLPGTPKLPAEPQHSLGWAENGDAGTFPGVNLMFAQMEGRVWPYPGVEPG